MGALRLDVSGDAQSLQGRVAGAHPLYLKHNVIWEERNLITL
jgi:hypothetical protein